MSYMEYAEIYSWIPQIMRFNEDVLMLVLADNRYGQRVFIQVGTNALGRTME